MGVATSMAAAAVAVTVVACGVAVAAAITASGIIPGYTRRKYRGTSGRLYPKVPCPPTTLRLSFTGAGAVDCGETEKIALTLLMGEFGSVQ